MVLQVSNLLCASTPSINQSVLPSRPPVGGNRGSHGRLQGNTNDTDEPSALSYSQPSSTAIHASDLVEDADVQFGAPPAIRSWATELLARHASSGTFRYIQKRPTATASASQDDFYRTALTLWDPSETWSYLFPKSYMPCPVHGFHGDQGVIRKGWAPHAPRRIFGIDECEWLLGRQFYCKDCAAEQRPHYFLAYNSESMHHLHACGLSFIVLEFPYLLSRKAGVTGQLWSLILNGNATGRYGKSIEQQSKELHTKRFMTKKALWTGQVYTFVVYLRACCRRLELCPIEILIFSDNIYRYLAALKHRGINHGGVKDLLDGPAVDPNEATGTRI